MTNESPQLNRVAIVLGKQQKWSQAHIRSYLKPLKIGAFLGNIRQVHPTNIYCMSAKCQALREVRPSLWLCSCHGEGFYFFALLQSVPTPYSPYLRSFKVH